MKVVGHQAEGMHLPAGFLAGFAQGVEEEQPVLVAPENGFAPVATIEDVIESSGKFDAEFSGHAAEFAPENATCQ